MSAKADAQVITTLDLLRHGQCEGGEIYRGSTDVPLTAKGWKQMEAAVGEASGWQRIISSPLERCQRFSEQQGQRWQIPVVTEKAFREMHFGDWEGRCLKEVWQSERESVRRFYADPNKVSPPNGESMRAVQDRLLPAWQALLTEYAGEHLLLVQHGGTIRVLLSWLLQMPLAAVTRFDIPYASLSRIQVYDDGQQQFPRLVFLNHGQSAVVACE